ncbi:class II fumarate hydratase [Brevibacillus sp. SYP-B805]|uniref:class II fumarate hydratase n=1 Tax=Brevibacillus sp. SYP-B805 TaxID=1578199 RepID=UPI0013EE1CA0|nr:class II fumarate hydratase [Brevibacillus sp. SYP-B805]NGQ95834.1 class II fumarate hydratase [Brevibacillus sp. SYP-B805]
MTVPAYRTMSDPLGEVTIPAEALYGPQTQRAVENFPISGLRLPRAFIRAQGIIKASAAAANRRTGQLEETIAQAIIQAAEEVIEGKWDAHFVVDVFQAGAGTSQNMNANEVIALRATELLGGTRESRLVHPNDHVNLAQSTNDTIPTAINISTAEMLQVHLLPSLRKLEQALWQKAEELMPVIKAGRTHLQDAVPIRLGQEFSGYAQTVSHLLTRLAEAQEGLYEIALGGNAVGTGINAHPRYAAYAIGEIARRTGMPFREATNRFAAMQNTSAAIHVHAVLKQLALHLIKITSDLRLLSSGPRTGLAELRLPAVQPGSSIMPGKVNPVILEMVYMVAAQVIGNDMSVTMAGVGSQLEINVMMPLIAFNLLFSITILSNAIQVLVDKCIMGIEANERQCTAWLEASLSLVTALNPFLGYDRAAAIAKKAYAEDKSLRQVLQEEGLWTPAVQEALDPARMV